MQSWPSLAVPRHCPWTSAGQRIAAHNRSVELSKVYEGIWCPVLQLSRPQSRLGHRTVSSHLVSSWLSGSVYLAWLQTKNFGLRLVPATSKQLCFDASTSKKKKDDKLCNCQCNWSSQGLGYKSVTSAERTEPRCIMRGMWMTKTRQRSQW